MPVAQRGQLPDAIPNASTLTKIGFLQFGPSGYLGGIGKPVAPPSDAFATGRGRQKRMVWIRIRFLNGLTSPDSLDAMRGAEAVAAAEPK